MPRVSGGTSEIVAVYIIGAVCLSVYVCPLTIDRRRAALIEFCCYLERAREGNGSLCLGKPKRAERPASMSKISYHGDIDLFNARCQNIGAEAEPRVAQLVMTRRSSINRDDSRWRSCNRA